MGKRKERGSTDLGVGLQSPPTLLRQWLRTGISRGSRIFVHPTSCGVVWLHSIVLYTWLALGICYLLCSCKTCEFVMRGPPHPGHRGGTGLKDQPSYPSPLTGDDHSHWRYGGEAPNPRTDSIWVFSSDLTQTAPELWSWVPPARLCPHL